MTPALAVLVLVAFGCGWAVGAVSILLALTEEAPDAGR